jgi:tetratricopeptide (TPR) repeat protein
MALRILAAVFLVLFPVSRYAALCQQSPNDSLEDGIRALNAGDFASAEHIFSDLHKHAPSAENTGYLAMAEAGAGNLAQAISHFQESIRLGNDSAPVHYNLGIAYLNSGRGEDGIRELRAATAKDPNFLPSQRALGFALLDAGRPHQAVPYLEQARRQSPHDAEIWVDLVRAQFEVRNDNAALQIADQAMKAIRGNPRMNQALADLCLKYDQLQKARYILEDSSELMPGDPNIALSLARVSLQAGEPMEALAALKDVPPEAGLPGESMYLRGEARILTKDYVIAEEDLSAAIQADSRNPTYLVAYARLQQLEGDYRKALTTLNKASELNAQMPEIPFRMAVSYYYLDLWEQAAPYCQAAIQLRPSYVLPYLLLGAARVRQSDFQGAQDAFQHAVTMKPGVAFFHVALAVAQYKAGSLEASLKELDQALVLDPQEAQAHFYRAQVLSRQHDRRKAIEELETAVALKPHYRRAYAELARLYSADGQSERAKAALASQALELQNDENENKRMQQELRDSSDEIGDVLRFSDILKSR